MAGPTYNTGDELRDSIRGNYNAQPGTDPDTRLCDGLTRDVARFTKGADSAAGDLTANAIVGSVPQRSKVRNVWYTPAAALTANITNFKRIIVRHYWSNGTFRGELANTTTQPIANGGTGDWTAKARVTLAELGSATVGAVLAGNAVVEAGGAIEVQIAIGGTGVITPAGVLEIQYESY